jgi:hypothetical protein
MNFRLPRVNIYKYRMGISGNIARIRETRNISYYKKFKGKIPIWKLGRRGKINTEM